MVHTGMIDYEIRRDGSQSIRIRGRKSTLLLDALRLGPPPWTFDGATRATRHLSDMIDYFPADPAALANDPLIYEIFDWLGQGLTTDLMVTVTAIHPGSVGGLFHHTKGHFHKDPDGCELVIGMAGAGCLELVDRELQRRTVELTAGIYVSVEPGWAHRVVNSGKAPLLYLSVSSAAIGHDYESVRRAGWMPGRTGAENPVR